MNEGDTGLPQKAPTVLIRVVPGIHHPFDTGVDDHLGAGETRLVGHTDHAAVRADAVQRGLNDGVLLGVEREYAMAVDDQMAYIVAVGQAGGRAVVAGGENTSAADDHRTHMGAITGTARRNSEGDIRKVLGDYIFGATTRSVTNGKSATLCRSFGEQ